MKVMTWFLVTLVLIGGGAALGWVVLPALLSHDNPLPPPDLPPQLIAAQHRFALTPDDVKLDREKPAVAVTPGGQMLLAWASQTTPDDYTLFLARSEDMGTSFGPPTAFRKVPIHRHTMTSKGKERIMVTPLLARLAAHGDAITLGWLEPDRGGNRIRFLAAVSRDGGRSFGDPVCVHGESPARPNYTALTTGLDGSTACLWLDSRTGTQLPFGSVAPAGTAFAADVQAYAGTGDKGVCPCCDVDILRSGDGATFAAFRNAKDGQRDIYVARSTPSSTLAFGDAVPVTRDSWAFDGCPHDGPSLAVSGERVHVLWMDAHSGKRQVYLATSALDKLSFTPRPLTPSISEEQGHPRITAAGGVLYAVWDQALPGTPPADPTAHQHGPPAGTGRTIVYTTSRDNGQTFAEPQALAPVEAVFQTHPGVTVAADGTVLVSWNETTEEGKSVVVARLSAKSSALPCCCGDQDGGCCDVPSRGATLHGK